MSLTGDLIFGDVIAKSDISNFMRLYNAQEANSQYGGICQYCMSCGDGFVWLEIFEKYEKEIYEEADQIEFDKIVNKLGCEPRTTMNLEISRLADPQIYLKIFEEICCKWNGVYDNHEGRILRFDEFTFLFPPRADRAENL